MGSGVPEHESINALFAPACTADYDFSRAPELITLRKTAAELLGGSAVDAAQWARVQEGFLARARDRDTYPLDNLQRHRMGDEAFFRRRGPLRGTVLDLGGGWGLYREWWEGGEGNLFVVHDPGVERHLRGVYPTHRECFSSAFTRPMTFVEGFGESLPYRDGVFDTALIAAALDHCADPSLVVKETRRCLKPGGTLLILQSCTETSPRNRRTPWGQRLVRYAVSPHKLIRHVWRKAFGPPMHLHHFTAESMRRLFLSGGFGDPLVTPVQEDVLAFESAPSILKGSA